MSKPLFAIGADVAYRCKSWPRDYQFLYAVVTGYYDEEYVHIKTVRNNMSWMVKNEDLLLAREAEK